MKDLCVVIPMKDPVYSKQRLSPYLPPAMRKNLSITLFKQTLKSLCFHFPQWQRVVVTPSLCIADIASTFGCKVIFEHGNKGLNHALNQATAWSTQEGYQRQLILPADIARLDKAELLTITSLVQDDVQVAIGQAHDGGTNALCSSPPNAIEFCFGEKSSKAHQQQAKARGLKSRTMALKHLSHDVDYPSDLQFVHQLNAALSA